MTTRDMRFTVFLKKQIVILLSLLVFGFIFNFQNGSILNAKGFNGINSYVSMPNRSLSDLRRGEALTISLWFKASDLNGVRYSNGKWGVGWRTILSKGNGYSGKCSPGAPFYKAVGYNLRIMHHKVQFSLRNNNFKRNYVDLYSPNIRPNEWYNVVVTVSAVPGNGFAKMYLNGRKVYSKRIPNPTDYVNGQTLYLGATYYDRSYCQTPKYYNYVNGSTGLSHYFKGRIENVRFFHRILSDQEIANLYNAKKSVFTGVPSRPGNISSPYPPPRGTADISGTWHWFDGETVWIYKNGTSRSSRGNQGRWSRRWNGTRYIYTINWNNGQYIDTLTLHGNTLDGHNQGGTHVYGGRG